MSMIMIKTIMDDIIRIKIITMNLTIIISRTMATIVITDAPITILLKSLMKIERMTITIIINKIMMSLIIIMMMMVMMMMMIIMMMMMMLMMMRVMLIGMMAITNSLTMTILKMIDNDDEDNHDHDQERLTPTMIMTSIIMIV